MRELEQGYAEEVDLIDKNSWDDLMPQFEDASYYQTWSFGAIHYGEKQMSHIVLKKDERAVGMAQLRIIRVFRLPVGIAYVSSGPMCRLKGEHYEEQRFRNMIRALYNEYVLKRRYFLRIVPQIIDNGENLAVKAVFAEEGYSRSDGPGHNVIVDLSPSLDEIRQNMHHKWRQTLKSAEKKNQDIIEGTSNEICQMALRLIGEMKDRKRFFGGNQSEAIRVHMDLPEKLKLKLIVCMDNNEPVATLGWATYGTIGIPLVGATGNKALQLKSSYVLWWKMIEYYKTQGFAAVDLGAVNERRNPGGYYFKTHILGKQIKEQNRYIGQFDASANFLSWVFFKAIYNSRETYISIRSKL